MGTITESIAHIGDLRRTDIAGARGTGAKAILFTGVHEDRQGPDPDHHLAAWSHLPSILEVSHE
jgi:FMN phosphatase YigB (HAD superfamily)